MFNAAERRRKMSGSVLLRRRRLLFDVLADFDGGGEASPVLVSVGAMSLPVPSTAFSGVAGLRLLLSVSPLLLQLAKRFIGPASRLNSFFVLCSSFDENVGGVEREATAPADGVLLHAKPGALRIDTEDVVGIWCRVCDS